MTSNVSSARTTITRKARSLALVSVAAAAVAAVGIGPSLAQADPGDTFVAIGSSQLLQSEDLSAIQIPLDTLSVRLNRDEPFSACLGESATWTTLLKGAAKPVSGTWTTAKGGKALYETIGQASSEAQAKRWEATLIKYGIKNCQGTKAPFDFHYGATDSSNVGSGHATWAVSYRGKSTKADGGVAVFRKGTDVGLVEVSGTFGPADQMMESVAKESTNRLIG